MRKQPTKLHDPAVRAAVLRLEEHTRTLARRVRDYWSSDERVERTLALIEAEVAAKLVRAGACELNLRLLPHGVRHDIDAEIARRTPGLEGIRRDHENRYGPIPEA